MPLGSFSKKEHVAITTLGLEFALAELAGGAVGLWLDKKWETSPWLFLLGVGLGFVLGMYMIIRGAQSLESSQNNAAPKEIKNGHH